MHQQKNRQKTTQNDCNTQEREKIFMVHLKPITLQDDLKTDDVAKRMASLTPGFVGADIVTWWHWELILEQAMIQRCVAGGSIYDKVFRLRFHSYC